MLDIDKCKNEILSDKFSVSLDSRLIKPGEYFIAIKGENHDGHKYIEDVMSKGAAGVLEDTDLYTLAKFKIDSIKPKIIGITGSTGKSSVTSFVTQILETKYTVCKGSLNTKLGLSVDVINYMDMHCEVFIAEMGMNGLGQIKAMVDMFKPNIAVITTINQTHAEKLGSIENIVKAKAEILSNMGNDDVAVLNKDNVYTRKIGKTLKCKTIWFGEKDNADYNPRSFELCNCNLLGKHNRMNLLAAVAVSIEMGMSEAEIKNALPNVKAPKGRLNLVEGMSGSRLIDDTYNASPVSTKFAIDVLAEQKGATRIAIIGDMLELGRFTKRYHKDIGKYLKDKDINTLITAGDLSEFINTEGEKYVENTYHIQKSTDFKEIIPKLVIDENTVILIKGSQGMRMEKITEMLMKNPKDAENLLVRQDVRWK